MTAIATKDTSPPRVFFYRSEEGATLMDVRTALVQLKAELLDASASQIDISSAEIVVAELLNNIVKHAHHETQRGWFELQCTFLKSGLKIQCRDNGIPMPGGSPPDGNFPSIKRSLSDLPEGGWGWSLVHALSAELCYGRDCDTNKVCFRIPKSAQP